MGQHSQLCAAWPWSAPRPGWAGYNPMATALTAIFLLPLTITPGPLDVGLLETTLRVEHLAANM